MYSEFENLCKERGVSPYRVAKECGFRPSTLSDWKMGRYTPKVDKMMKIAAFFDVPLERLLNVA